MRKSILRRFLVAALLSGAAWAQGIQNHDMFFSAGPAWNTSRAIGGTNVALDSSWGASVQAEFGYQVARKSAASLMVDFSFAVSDPGTVRPSGDVGGLGKTNFDALTIGLRFMVPVHARLSFYPVAGGGYGSFLSPRVLNGATTLGGSTLIVGDFIGNTSTANGVFVFGGGADVRLSKRFSLRWEVRDFVTGKDLGSATGRHHVLPFFGVALHI